jgi:uncharacterized YigZ family protein
MTVSDYPIPTGTARSECVIKRSRFITTLAHAPSPAVAREWVGRLRVEFPVANHHCWAFTAGPPGDQRFIGCSDDGEPRGTAGKPMLQVLRNCGVGEIVAVVTRFFGGTKLGKGGLVKAYTQGVQAALVDLRLTEKRQWSELSLTCGYDQLETVKHICRQFGAHLEDAVYGEGVSLRIAVTPDHCEALTAALPRRAGKGGS